MKARHSFLFFAALASAQQTPYTWTGVGPMGAARAQACAVLLQDGRAMVIGGVSADGSVLSSAEFFTIGSATMGAGAAGTYSPAPSLNTARAQQSCTVLANGQVLVAGGTDNQGNAIASVEVFDPVANVFQTIASLNQARWGHQATLLQDGRVLLAGGSSGPGSALNTLEWFDPVAGQFNLAAATMSSARKSFAAALLQNGQVLFAGGSDGNFSLASTDIFDPPSNTVTPASGLMLARAALTATTLFDGTVLIVGGNDGYQDLASAEIYDPVAKTSSFSWGAPTIARSAHLAFLIPNNGNVLIVGGLNNGSATAACELYTFQGEFMAVGSTSTPRTQAAGVAIAPGMVLTAGGTNDEGPEERSGLNTGPTIEFREVGANTPTELQIGGANWTPGETVSFELQIQNNTTTTPQLGVLSPAVLFTSTGAEKLINDPVFTGAQPGFWTLSGTGLSSGLTASFKTAVVFPAVTLTTSCTTCPVGTVSMLATIQNANPTLIGAAFSNTDTVTFLDGSTKLGTAAISVKADGSAYAAFVGSFTAGAHQITANYSGGTDGYIPGSATANITANKAATSISVTFSQNPAGSFTPINVLATVPVTTTIEPNGSVIFFDGTNQIGTASLIGPVVSGASVTAIATLRFQFGLAGAHSITARYVGDSNYLASTSPPVSLNVLQGLSPGVTLTVSPTSVFAGQFVTMTATITYPFGDPVPAGSVTFYEGTTPVGTVGPGNVTPTSETAIVRVSPFLKGTFNITAHFNSDGLYNSVSSSPVALTVQ